MKKFIIIILSVFMFLLIGTVVTKLTVHDLVPVDANARQCVELGINHYENLFEQIALYFGKRRVITVTPNSATIESFTIFHIPLGTLWGQPDTKLSVDCNPAE